LLGTPGKSTGLTKTKLLAMKKNYLFLFFLLAIFTTCGKDKNKLVDKELEVYVDRFFAEAALREMEVTDNNLEVVFTDLTEESICGLGHFRYLGTDLRKVEINPDFFCWGFHDDLARENLVFHELGHAILRRTHVNTVLPTGLPAQMMCDGNSCNVFAYYDKYTLGKRAYYLDKLFRLSTQTPDWGKIKSKATTFFKEDVESAEVEGQLIAPNDNFTGIITENPLNQSKSIALTAVGKFENNNLGGWTIQLDNPDIAEGVDLKFSTQIIAEDLKGEGINLILRTYSGDNTDSVISAATSRKITDLSNLTAEIEALTLIYYPSDVQQIEIILQILPNTSGTVYFDDLNLSVMEY